MTAEVGTGKTLLCRRFLATMRDDHMVAYLPNPLLDPRSLLLAIAEELGLSLRGMDYHFHLVKDLNTHLLGLAEAGKTVVVCLDEAQCMPDESLEALRLLSNLETEKRKLMQVVMFGQPELDQKLAKPSARQLRQRISFHYEMTGLRPPEVRNYLAHRLRVAGHSNGDIFSAAAARLVSAYTRGTPRLVNVVANKSLLAAFGEGKGQVGASHVRVAGKDTEGAYAVAPWRFW